MFCISCNRFLPPRQLIHSTQEIIILQAWGHSPEALHSGCHALHAAAGHHAHHLASLVELLDKLVHLLDIRTTTLWQCAADGWS